MVKKVICSRVKHAPIDHFSLVDENVFVFKTGYNWQTMICSLAEFSEEPTLLDGLDYVVKQTLTMNCAVSAAKLKTLHRPQVFLLTVSDGRNIVFGDLNYFAVLRSAKNEGGVAPVIFERTGIEEQL